MKSTTTVTSDVVDLCSDSDDEKPKPKPNEDPSRTIINAMSTIDSLLLGKKHRLQTEAVLDLTSYSPAKFSKTEEKFVINTGTTEDKDESSRNCNTIVYKYPESLPQSEAPAFGSSSQIIPTPLIFIDGKDNLTITEGIPQLLLTHFPKTPGSDLVTCVGHAASSTTSTSIATTTTTARTTLRHIQQKDKWSCGFRNLQMMLTALLPVLPPDHAHFQGPHARDQAGSFAIYSLRQIQQLLEELWKAGWDTTGAQHYNYKIAGKQSQIGAAEVSSVLSFRGFDNTLVQFIKCAESRRQLGPFCWAYFRRRPGCTCLSGAASVAVASSSTSTARSSRTTVEQLLASNATGARVVSSSCSCAILPLYLQWEGHSVTIMGVERQTTGGGGFDDSAQIPVLDKINLLVLDPAKDGTKLEQALSRSDLAPARLACKKLQHKDCQIVLCTSRSLSLYEMEERKQQVCAVTAAQDAVMRIAHRGY